MKPDELNDLIRNLNRTVDRLSALKGQGFLLTPTMIEVRRVGDWLRVRYENVKSRSEVLISEHSARSILASLQEKGRTQEVMELTHSLGDNQGRSPLGYRHTAILTSEEVDRLKAGLERALSEEPQFLTVETVVSPQDGSILEYRWIDKETGELFVSRRP